MARDEVTAANPARELDLLESLGRGVDTAWRCNRAAVDAGNLDLTFPSRQTIAAFAGRADALVVRSHMGGAAQGLGIFTDSPKGGYLRWLVVPPGPRFEAIAREIIDAGVERFGSAWGRVSNPLVHARLVAMGYRVDDADPDVLHAGG